MVDLSPKFSPPSGEAVRFWAPRRLWYNGALLVVVFLWLRLTWPHFRPALTLEALGKMLVLALLANVCYCAAYVVEAGIQAVSSDTARRRFRWASWILGVLLALLIENYWIADEIYPDIHDKQGAMVVGFGQMFRGPTRGGNMDFPAPLSCAARAISNPADSIGNQSSDYQCDISSCPWSPYFVAHA